MNHAMPEPPALLRVHLLRKAYADRVILDDLSFRVSAGERIGIMGPSGSGKSTLLNCLAGIDAPDSGTILLADEPVTGRTPDDLARLRRDRVSTVFQFFHLLPTLSVFENIELPLQLLGIDRAEREQRVQELIDAVQLEARQDALPGQLSGRNAAGGYRPCTHPQAPADSGGRADREPGPPHR